MALQFTENRQRNIGLSVTSNPRTVLRSTGLAEATQAEAIAGTIQHRYMSPLRVAQVVANEATGDLTRVDDTNVTLTLGGTPTDALWNDVSITVGWSGTLAASRGGWAADISAQSGIPILTAGVAAFFSPGAGVQTFLTTPSSANLASAVTDETGTGALVFANTPTLVTPILGTPTSVTLTNGTGLPIATGVSGLGTGIATALAVNVGTAGSVVVNGGALGTPSSGTLTNCTGLPTAGLVDAAVTYVKIQDVSAASRLLGRGSAAGSGDVEEITLGTGLSMSGTTLSSTGSIGGSTGATDNAALRADGVGGATLQASALIIADTTGSLSRSGNGGIPLQGTNTNDSAAAGYLGEYVESVVAEGSAVSLTTATSTDITSISLTAGDWDVVATNAFAHGATTNVTVHLGGISTTSATLPTGPLGLTIERYGSGGLVPNGTVVLYTGQVRLSLSATTTVYLVGRASFTVSTCSGYGGISARRVR